MQHVQLHATFFSCIRQVTKDKFSTSELHLLNPSTKVDIGHEDEESTNPKIR